MVTVMLQWIGGLASALLLLCTARVYAQVPEHDVSRVIHVNMHHPLAADDNPGTPERPLKTINGAATIAKINRHNQVGTRIVVSPGRYRETIMLDLHDEPSKAPIIVEAAVQGTVTISGSEVWTGWEQQGASYVYAHAWPYQWGLSANPWEDEHVTVAPIVRRREMVFVDGTALVQVLSPRQLHAGSFYIAEDQGMLLLALPGDAPLGNRVVEVATRDRLLEVRNASHIVLRNLTFQHASSPIQESAVRFFDAANITIEHCTFVHNNWIGLGLWHATNVQVRQTVANDNGALGMVAWKVDTLLFEENETSYNNWRGAQGGFHGWAVAGMKQLRIHNGIYRKHTAVGNRARGVWWDYDNANIRLEEALICKNLLDGVFIEASQGPVTIAKSVLCHNAKGAGVLSTNSTAVTLHGNAVYGNGGPQLKVDGGNERRVPDWQSGVERMLRMQDWHVQDNIFVGHHPGQLLVDTPDWPHFLRSLTGENNLWYNPSIARAFKVGTAALDFSGWQAVTGKDVGSRFADPRTTEVALPRIDVFSDTLPPQRSAP